MSELLQFFDRKLTREQILGIHNVRVFGTGTPIVLAHGFGSSQNAWTHQINEFRNTHQVIVFDHAGSVPSNFSAFDPARYTSMHAYAADLLEILDALNLDESTLIVGHSMSGLAALLASLHAPDRIRRIVTLGTSACYRNSEDYRGGFDRDELDAIYRAMEDDYAAWSLRFAHAVVGTDKRSQDADDFARTLSELPPDIALPVLRLAFECDYRSDLPEIQARVHVIQSGHDIAVPVDAAAYLARAIPEATFSVLHTTRGHLPHVTAPSLVNSILRRWVM